MKTKTVLLISLFCCAGCDSGAQNRTTSQELETIQAEDLTSSVKNTEKYTVMKKIDIDRFNKYRDGDYNFTDSSGMEVRQVEDFNFDTEKVVGYDEYRRYPNSAYEYYCRYDEKGNLIRSVSLFYRIPIGYEKIYDTLGYSRDGENYDAPFKFSVEDLISKMKKEYDVNIVDTKICRNVSRGVFDTLLNRPIYSILIYDLEVRGKSFGYLVDGNNGEIFFTTTRFMGEKKGSLVDEYLRTRDVKSKKE